MRHALVSVPTLWSHEETLRDRNPGATSRHLLQCWAILSSQSGTHITQVEAQLEGFPSAREALGTAVLVSDTQWPEEHAAAHILGKQVEEVGEGSSPHEQGPVPVPLCSSGPLSYGEG